MRLALGVVVVRDEAPDDDISRAIVDAGGVVAPLRLMRIAPPQDVGALDDAIANIARYDVVAFTSRHAVDAVASRCAPAAHTVVAAVGPATAARLGAVGWRVDVVGDAGGRALAERLAPSVATHVAKKRVLLPQAEMAHADLADDLAGAGADVNVVIAYRSVVAGDADDVRAAFATANAAGVFAVVVTSPKRVRRLRELCPPGSALGNALSAAAIVAIGDTTAAAARDVGLVVAAVASAAAPIPVCEALASLHTLR